MADRFKDIKRKVIYHTPRRYRLPNLLNRAPWPPPTQSAMASVKGPSRTFDTHRKTGIIDTRHLRHR